MLSYDDPVFTVPSDPRVRLLIRLLSKTVWSTQEIALTLEAAGLSPGDYPLDRAILAWSAAVPDSARRGTLATLVGAVSGPRPAFRTELDEEMRKLLEPAVRQGGWYRHEDPYECRFVGLRSARAVIDRVGLRSGLRDLAADQYWVLVVHGQPRSGKSHTWYMVDHLRTVGHLLGVNRFARVTTHSWSGDVTGEAFAQALASKLGLAIDLAPSGELDDARVRKFLDRLVGVYPSGDEITRWIVLDGLDRPGVQEGVRDLARGLIQLVEDRELPQTRLIVTGLDPLGLNLGYAVRTEEIPVIDRRLLRTFLGDVAQHMGHDASTHQLEAWVDEILGPGPEPRDLSEIETEVLRMVTTHWVVGGGGDG